MKAFIDGVTRLDQFLTHEFLMKEISVDSVSSLYKISLNEFDHPSWWLEENNFVESNLKKPRFSKMIRMEIQNGISTPFDTPVKVSVEKISFVHNNSIALTLISGCTLLYFFIYALLFMVVQRKIKSKQTVISYKELVVENDSDKDMQRLMNAVARHFADPEFTVEKLAREAGVSASRIPGMLKERFNMNFKQYLNIIRITEAKRLLRETDNQITTCAYNVGYNNIPHFNRTFKQLEGISPKEYRKNPKERKPAEDTISS
jgi:AraC-like DNA-binding protein